MQQTTSTTENRDEAIAGGPSKFELMLGLFDHTMANQRTVKFSVGGEMVEVAINEVGRESGDGESWNFTGFIPGTPSVAIDGGTRSVTPLVQGWYTTRRSEGWLKRGVLMTDVMTNSTSTTQPRIETVVGGPSKFELMLGLFDHTMANQRTVKFSVGGEMVEVAINEVGRESGSGESWVFKGFVPSRLISTMATPRHTLVEGSYTTRSNEGWLKRGVIR